MCQNERSVREGREVEEGGGEGGSARAFASAFGRSPQVEKSPAFVDVRRDDYKVKASRVGSDLEGVCLEVLESRQLVMQVGQNAILPERAAARQGGDRGEELQQPPNGRYLNTRAPIVPVETLNLGDASLKGNTVSNEVKSVPHEGLLGLGERRSTWGGGLITKGSNGVFRFGNRGWHVGGGRQDRDRTIDVLENQARSRHRGLKSGVVRGVGTYGEASKKAIFPTNEASARRRGVGGHSASAFALAGSSP